MSAPPPDDADFTDIRRATPAEQIVLNRFDQALKQSLWEVGPQETLSCMLTVLVMRGCDLASVEDIRTILRRVMDTLPQAHAAYADKRAPGSGAGVRGRQPKPKRPH